MQNGQDNAPAPSAAPMMPPAAPQIQINPAQAAAFALEFLERASHTRAERERFDMAQALLTAIMQGRVIISAPPPPPMMGVDAPASETTQ
jgi:hypothetical protein